MAMLNWSILALGAAVFTVTATIWHLYMFQMNHYIHPDHWRWMFHAPRNLRSVFPPLLAAAFSSVTLTPSTASRALCTMM